MWDTSISVHPVLIGSGGKAANFEWVAVEMDGIAWVPKS